MVSRQGIGVTREGPDTQPPEHLLYFLPHTTRGIYPKGARKTYQAAPLGHVVIDGLRGTDVVIDAGLPRQRPLASQDADSAQPQPGRPGLDLYAPALHRRMFSYC